MCCRALTCAQCQSRRSSPCAAPPRPAAAMCVICWHTCRVHESIAACERVLQLNPTHYLALSGKGMCHAKLGQHGCAADSWRAALAINPFLPQLRRFLAEIDSSP